MKKSFVTILALCFVAASASPQSFIIDSSANYQNGSGPTATSGGLVWLDPDGNISHAVLDNSQDINLGILWGTSATSVTTPLNIDPLNLNTGLYAGCGNWIATQPTGQSDINFYTGGAITDPWGNEYLPPGEAIGTTVWLVIQGWTGNSPTYANALADGGLRGQTTPFSVTLVSRPTALQPDTHTMSALVLTPEPSMPALLSAFGAAAFALLRRRK